MLIHVLKSVLVGVTVLAAGFFTAMLDDLPLDFLPHVLRMAFVATCAAFFYFLD